MLSQHRRVAANAGWRLLELDRMDRLTVLARDRMLTIPDNSRAAYLRIVANILRRIDRRADRIEVTQNLEPFMRRLGEEAVLELVVLLMQMRNTVGHRPEARIVRQLRPSDRGD